MEQTLGLRCRCGHVRGTARVSPRTGTHIVCYCDDCQAFAHHLGRADVLDAAGGTAIFQMAPARLQITHGLDAVRCLRLSPEGMLRWYTDCCRTPIGNTVAGRLPFVGLIQAFMDFDSAALERDALLGKPSLLMGKFAIGGLPKGAHPKLPPALLLRIATRLAAWWLSGKGQPSPFCDAQYQPRVTPSVLTPEQRASLRSAATQAVAS